MKMVSLRVTASLMFLFFLCLPVFAAQLDDHYLTAFGEQSVSQTGTVLQKAILLPTTGTAEPPHCGTPLKHGLQRDWNQLEPAAMKVLAKQLAAPVLSGTESTLFSPSGRFLIHYTTSGADAVPSLAWVQTVAQTFDDVTVSYAARGWNLAPTGGAPYNVYLLELSAQRLYGTTTSAQSLASPGFTNAVGSFIEIDNDFLEPVYQNALSGPLTAAQKALQSLQIAAAHEYHHAIQYGYNFFFDIWYAEATATWHEDELYDPVNQLYNYLPAWFNNSTQPLDIAADVNTGGGYGRWIINRYLAEQHGTIVIRNIWEKLATLNSPGNNAGISMIPVIDSVLLTTFSSSLKDDYLGFVKRIYTKDWASHTSDISLIHPYTPLTTFSLYPVNVTTAPLTSAIILTHDAFAFYKFTPAPAVASLTITINKTSGIQTALFRKSGAIISEITAAADGSFTVSGFDLLDPAADEVVLLVANTTTVNGHMASFSSDGTASPVTEPGAAAATGGGGGGGCFIATAAYGSYLDPHVRILRDFRDRYLLTNSPGRAFVAFYYRLSPPVAAFIARHSPLRLLVRLLLTPVVVGIAHPAAAGILLLAAAGALTSRVRRKRITADIHPDPAL